MKKLATYATAAVIAAGCDTLPEDVHKFRMAACEIQERLGKTYLECGTVMYSKDKSPHRVTTLHITGNQAQIGFLDELIESDSAAIAWIDTTGFGETRPASHSRFARVVSVENIATEQPKGKLKPFIYTIF